MYDRLYHAACLHLERNQMRLGGSQTVNGIRKTRVDDILLTDEEIFEAAWGRAVLDSLKLLILSEA